MSQATYKTIQFASVDCILHMPTSKADNYSSYYTLIGMWTTYKRLFMVSIFQVIHWSSETVWEIVWSMSCLGIKTDKNNYDFPFTDDNCN